MTDIVTREIAAWKAYRRYVVDHVPARNINFCGDSESARLFREWRDLYRERKGYR